MPISPHKGESQSEWMSRCVPEMIGTGEDKRPQEQAVAACLNIWRETGHSAPKKQNGGCPEPDDGESHSDFLDRCTETHDEDECQLAWEDAQDEGRAAGAIIQKTHAEVVQGMEFVLSDDSLDRMGDTISADGWQIDSFAKNPIALFNHNPSFPIGRWQDLRVDKNALKGRLVMAPLGTSNRIDEIRKLIEAGILKAVSVGFRDIESEPLDKKNPFSGRRFLKQELVETSLVSVPANPNALAVVKSLGISPQTQELIFAKHGNQDEPKRREFTGKHAKATRSEGRRAMQPLSERISNVQQLIVESEDALATHWDGIDQTNISDADMQKATDLNATLASLKKTHTALVESERLLGQTATSNGNGSGGNGVSHRALQIYAPRPDLPEAPKVFATPKKKDFDLLDYLVQAGTVGFFSKMWGKSREETRVKIAETYPHYNSDGTKVSAELILRAASAPAMTTVTGWAAELVQQTYADLMPLLMPASILNRLSGRGLTLSFGTAGRIIIPTRSRTPTIAGSFVGEGLAIPVRQGAFTTQTVVPKKLAVISVWTREMGDHSVPAIEGLIREAIQQDTSVAIDTVLIDANAATTIRPAGLLNGVAATTATAGGGLAALIGDITALLGALTTSTYGNVRSPVWLANPTDMLRASLVSAANTGIFPFRDEIRAGTLNTVPIIDSATVPAKTLILVDAADFVVVGGEAARMELSDQATLHMEDTNPADLVASPSTVAAPQRSLFQTDSIALRMVLPLNWVQRRAGTIAWTSNVTW